MVRGGVGLRRRVLFVQMTCLRVPVGCVFRDEFVSRELVGARATASRTYFGPRTCLGPRTWNISICAVHTFERRSGSGGHESVGCVVGFVAQMRTAMEGAHAQQRQLRDVLVGDAAEAAATRQRVQRGLLSASTA